MNTPDNDVNPEITVGEIPLLKTSFNSCFEIFLKILKAKSLTQENQLSEKEKEEIVVVLMDYFSIVHRTSISGYVNRKEIKEKYLETVVNQIDSIFEVLKSYKLEKIFCECFNCLGLEMTPTKYNKEIIRVIISERMKIDTQARETMISDDLATLANLTLGEVMGLDNIIIGDRTPPGRKTYTIRPMESLQPSSMPITEAFIPTATKQIQKRVKEILAAAAVIAVIVSARLGSQQKKTIENSDNYKPDSGLTKNQKDAESEYVSPGSLSQSAGNKLPEKTRINIKQCKIDLNPTTNPLLFSYLNRLDEGTPKFFSKHFRAVVSNLSYQYEENLSSQELKIKLFNEVQIQLSHSENQLIQQFVQDNQRNIKRFLETGSWDKAGTQSSLLFNILKPICRE